MLFAQRQLPSSEEMMRSTEEYHRAREEAGVPRRLSHAIFFDFEYCNEFGGEVMRLPTDARVEEACGRLSHA